MRTASIFKLGLVSLLFLIVALNQGVFSAMAANPYPSKAITLIVPYSPGGRTDLTGRIVSEHLKTHLNVPVVIKNVPGASSVSGSKEVANSNPDGYTLGFFSTGFLTSQYTVTTPNDIREFELIGLINMDPAAIVVSTKSEWKTLKELVEYAKSNPGKVRSGINTGAATHIFEAAFAKAAGITFKSVPFTGGGERVPALLGGHIDCDFEVVAPFRSLAEAGKVRILGIAADERDALYPNIPTMKEGGVNLVISNWHGVFAPKGTPAEIIRVVEAALGKTARDPEFVKLMKESVLGIKYLNQAEFKAFFAQQDPIFKKTIQDLGLYKRPEK